MSNDLKCDVYKLYLKIYGKFCMYNYQLPKVASKYLWFIQKN